MSEAKKILAMIVATVLATPLLSQEPKPTPEMQRLSRLFVGSWSTNEKHEPGGIVPKGGIGKGSEKVALGPGGMSLISDYRASDPKGKFWAHTILWWDAKEQAYRSLECRNRLAAGCETGLWRWEGNDLVSDKEGWMMGWTDFTPTSRSFYMDASTDGRPMKRVMTIIYTKSGGK